MQATLDIDEYVLKAADERAQSTGRTPGAVISDLARFALEMEAINSLPTHNGFPQLRFDPSVEVTPELIDHILNETEG